MNYRTVADLASARASSPFEAGLLPDSEKERLCRSLLSEFGVARVKVGGGGEELIHGCLLPFGQHQDQDRNPTASLNWRKLTYKCLGCDAGGGLLWFIGMCRGVTGPEARRWLDDQTGAGADEQSLASLLTFFDAVYAPKQGASSAPIPKMAARALRPWLAIHPYLTDPPPHGRNIPEANVMAFQVGYAPDYGVWLEGRTRVESHRVVIPHFWRGDLVGWQTRRIVNDGTPKYVSSPDFPKDQTVFNYRPGGRVVVVESQMSVIACFDRCEYMGATFGASLTDRQLRLLADHQRVVLWLDNDESGWKATEKAGDFLSAYTDVWVVENPYNADPADLVKFGMGGEVDRLVAEAVPYPIWRRPTRLVGLEDCVAA